MHLFKVQEHRIRIEGIFTSDKRLEELVSKKAEPSNRSEQEIAGYREVLTTIHESYEYINPRANIILQLHRDLYSYSQGNVGGRYKNSDNIIAETDAEGHQKARFVPISAFETSEAMEELCTKFWNAYLHKRTRYQCGQLRFDGSLDLASVTILIGLIKTTG